MSDRDVDALDALEDAGPAIEGAGESAQTPVELPNPEVDVNYPKPTPLAQVVKDVAQWSGMCFVMEPSVSTPVQIFAPRKLAPEEAYELFLASLSLVGLRAVQVGTVIKIVRVKHTTVA